MGDDDDNKVVRVDFGRAPEPAPEDPSASPKREAFEQLIVAGMVLVNLDTRVAGVTVPDMHKGDPQLGLNFSHRFHIEDFTWDDRGVRASLSFGGQPNLCDVPWAAVFLLRSQVTGEAFLFPESVPEELTDMLDAVREQLDTSDGPPTRGPVGLPEPAPTPSPEVLDASPPPPAPEPVPRPDAESATIEDASQDEDPPDDDPPEGGGPRLKLVRS